VRTTRTLARDLCPGLFIRTTAALRSPRLPRGGLWSPPNVSNTVLTEAGSKPISLAFGGCASLPFNRSVKCNCSQRCRTTRLTWSSVMICFSRYHLAAQLVAHLRALHATTPPRESRGRAACRPDLGWMSRAGQLNLFPVKVKRW